MSKLQAMDEMCYSITSTSRRHLILTLSSPKMHSQTVLCGLAEAAKLAQYSTILVLTLIDCIQYNTIQ